jgi:hypothetical protein
MGNIKEQTSELETFEINSWIRTCVVYYFGDVKIEVYYI